MYVYVHQQIYHRCLFAFLVAFKVKVLDQIRTINRVQDGNVKTANKKDWPLIIDSAQSLISYNLEA